MATSLSSHNTGQALLDWLKGRNKSAFARTIGIHPNTLFHYLPRRDGRPAPRTMTVHVARRVVAATNGAVTFNDLFGTIEPAQAAA